MNELYTYESLSYNQSNAPLMNRREIGDAKIIKNLITAFP